MKFFKNNKAITLVELITTIAISSILFLVIFVFITDSVEELVTNEVKVNSVEEAFEFKDVMQRFIRSWYSDVMVFSWITEPSYTWAQNPNNVLYLEKLDWSEWILVWIVDINTNLLQRNYVYWDNFLWYRFLTPTEMNDIKNDNNLIYQKEFFLDKVYQWLRTKDFRVESYNAWTIVNMYYSVINLYDDSLFDKNFEDFYLDDLIVDEYSLVF